MNRSLLALPAIALFMFTVTQAAVAAELSIAPPPIASPSFEKETTRIDATYIGFDTLDGDGIGMSFNHKQPISDHSGFNVVGAAYGFSFDDGDSTATMAALGANYEHQFVGNDDLTVIAFGGPTAGYLYLEICAPICFEDDTTIYGLQGGAQVDVAVGSIHVAPFVIAQSISGSDVETFTTTSFGLDVIFGDWSLSGALNQTEDDDITIISLGYRY